MSLSDESCVMPYLCVSNAAKAIDFYVSVFGMKEVYRLPMGERVGHAELRFGGVAFYLSDEFPEAGIKSPTTYGGTSVSLLLYVPDVDALVAACLAHGCAQEGETKDEFFGDRAAKVIDPFGHRWFLHQRKEALSPQQIQQRFAAMAD